ncbi:MAG TPA: DMT family transporter [Kiloniellales bacterium]|nr:DMT family transporter [Kiloniellales bacterium]
MSATSLSVPLRSSLALAYLLAVLAVLAGSGMDIFGKTAMSGVEAGTWQGVALRWVFGLAMIVPVMVLVRRRPSMANPRVHILRMAISVGASWCYFEALSRLPLSLVVTVFYAEPLIALPLVRLVLKERLDWPRLTALAVGFGGIVAAAQPSGSTDLAGVGIALLGAFLWATLFIATKRYGEHESVLDLMFWMALACAVVATPIALADWRPLPAAAWWGVLGIALCGVLSSLCWLTALKSLDALVMTTLGYLGLPIGFAAALLLFRESPPVATWVGAALVLLAVAVLGYGERRHRVRTMLDAGPVPHP